jgi:hypothetical protein
MGFIYIFFNKNGMNMRGQIYKKINYGPRAKADETYTLLLKLTQYVTLEKVDGIHKLSLTGQKLIF